MRMPFILGLMYLVATLVIGDELVGDDEMEKYKEISNRLKEQLAEKARQTVVDIEQVIKAEESALECLGKTCQTNNIFIYYQCCQDNPGECCWYLRYWLTIVLMLILLKLAFTFTVWCLRVVCC